MKIKSQAYIQLGEEALQIVHQTFQPDTPVILHLLDLVDGLLESNSNSPPTLYVIQDGINCLPTMDYFLTNIKPAPIIVTHPTAHQKTNQLCNKQQLRIQFHNKHTPHSQVKPESTPLCSLTSKYQY